MRTELSHAICTRHAQFLMETWASFENWFCAQGRNGLGNIYVWASGDGGEDDDCNCDGYAASMWTISINSAINDGQNAHYDESCSSTLASTFSNGAKDPNTGVVSDTFINKRMQRLNANRLQRCANKKWIFSQSQ